MTRPFLLHLFTPAKHASPFDVNMAYDAGWHSVVPYTEVTLDDVSPLVQDAIFSRGPKGARCTGAFLGGRDPHLALDMLEHARRAMAPPFAISVLVDPSGAFTTSAAMVAAVERQLERVHGAKLQGARVLVLGGSGPVGSIAGVLAARAGAQACLVGRDGAARARAAANRCRERFGVALDAADGSSEQDVRALLQHADVVLAAARAGVQLLTRQQLAAAPKLKVAADINAVPPAGLEGIGATDDGAPIRDSASGAVGIGALAVGNIKYRVQQTLLIAMREAEEPACFSFERAFEIAREHVR